jgi:hypothetical protein
VKLKSIHLAGLGIGLVGLVAYGITLSSHHVDVANTDRVDFNRDIRPIFNKNCVACHGGVKEAANISFIYREGALVKGASGRPNIVPGNPNGSELIARVTARDASLRMPLEHPPLSPEQVELLKRWIKQGAQWENYWAFEPPVDAEFPGVKLKNWARHPLDQFVLSRLEKEGLQPSPEAEKNALLRRASLDLTGLPPTPAELEAFAADKSSDAYEKQVDRLLASPHFGERWASMWLDLARYADSRGYEKDLLRPGVWTYRDWVINAYNTNVPYDKFVITQLAGDLLPKSTFQDKIATGFNRMTLSNDEGGTDDEEFRLVAAMDRNATTWQVVNGVTMECVQCHSHPYDPLRHEDYYKSLAFFNTSRDADMRGDYPNLQIPKDTTKKDRVASLQTKSALLKVSVVARGRDLEQRLHPWTPLQLASGSIDTHLGYQRVVDSLGAGQILLDARDDTLIDASTDAIDRALDRGLKEATAQLAKRDGPIVKEDTIIRVSGPDAYSPSTLPRISVYNVAGQVSLPTVTAFRLEVPPDAPDVARHTPENGFYINGIDAWISSPGQPEQKVTFRYLVPDSEQNLEAGIARLTPTCRVPTADEKAQAAAMVIAARVKAPAGATGAPANGGRDSARRGRGRGDGAKVAENGAGGAGKGAKAQGNGGGNGGRAGANAAPPPPCYTQAAFVKASADAAKEDIMLRLAASSEFAANPKLSQTRWVIAVPDAPLKLAPGSRIRFELTQVRIINDKPAPVKHIRFLASSDARWTKFAHDPKLRAQISELHDAYAELRSTSSYYLPIMSEQPVYERRATKTFERGSFLTKVGPVLNPDVPGVFPKMPASYSHDRLGLAKWYFLPSQPLTARVAVNRYWEQLFGTGIVETLEDLGSAGEPPSNQPLLDWMALHYQNDLHWNTKALLREIVTSATYRQSAFTTPEMRQRDPRNRLFTRGPAQRLTVEMIRDQAMAASGLLTPTIGGPSVMPPQPEGFWHTIAAEGSGSEYVEAVGPDRYRRQLYTIIRRGAIYPDLVTFDGSNHLLSLPRRIATNTPLQALTTLNNPVYTEAASALGKRMAAEGVRAAASLPNMLGSAPKNSIDAQIQYGAILTLSRPLSSSELAALHGLFLSTLSDKTARAGSKVSDQDRAYTSVASALLNLHSALTR